MNMDLKRLAIFQKMIGGFQEKTHLIKGSPETKNFVHENLDPPPHMINGRLASFLFCLFLPMH